MPNDFSINDFNFTNMIHFKTPLDWFEFHTNSAIELHCAYFPHIMEVAYYKPLNLN